MQAAAAHDNGVVSDGKSLCCAKPDKGDAARTVAPGTRGFLLTG